ncbi:MAG: hypothetical protein BMS9Abin12_2132 [Acidimicrobiia bacterium]|nr:MAG: hypothetical protein BMS9Abin12_2132 [Acidimicrobiia bacterium]
MSGLDVWATGSATEKVGETKRAAEAGQCVDSRVPLWALSLLVLLLTAGLAGVSQLKFSSFLSDSINERLEIVATTSAQDGLSRVDPS